MPGMRCYGLEINSDLVATARAAVAAAALPAGQVCEVLLADAMADPNPLDGVPAGNGGGGGGGGCKDGGGGGGGGGDGSTCRDGGNGSGGGCNDCSL